MNSGQFIQWQDLFVVIDDGATPLPRYGPIESAMRDQAKHYPQGIACLVILPPHTKPPPDEIKRTVKNLLVRLASQLSSLAYVVEGTGFKGVAARATLVGMKIFASRPYPIYVETSLEEAVSKLFPHLAVGKTVTSDIGVIVKTIVDARGGAAKAVPPPATPRREGDATTK
jgi:hypothetical protein